MDEWVMAKQTTIATTTITPLTLSRMRRVLGSKPGGRPQRGAASAFEGRGLFTAPGCRRLHPSHPDIGDLFLRFKDQTLITSVTRATPRGLGALAGFSIVDCSLFF